MAASSTRQLPANSSLRGGLAVPAAVASVTHAGRPWGSCGPIARMRKTEVLRGSPAHEHPWEARIQNSNGHVPRPMPFPEQPREHRWPEAQDQDKCPHLTEVKVNDLQMFPLGI